MSKLYLVLKTIVMLGTFNTTLLRTAPPYILLLGWEATTQYTQKKKKIKTRIPDYYDVILFSTSYPELNCVYHSPDECPRSTLPFL